MERPSRSSHWPPSTPANGGAAEGVQRSWLDPKRPAKANLSRPRKALGRVHGRAVRFGGSATGATLLAGEGIETVLSLVTAVPGIHAAAALSAGSLGTFKQPQDLSLLVIARDKDVEGRHAANRLQRRCVKRGIPSIVIAPERSVYRGRDAGYPAPPAQIRTCPLRHPAPPLGCIDGESSIRPRVSDFQPGPMGSGQSRDVIPSGAVLLRPAA